MQKESPKKPHPKQSGKLVIEATFEQAIQMFADHANNNTPRKPKSTKKV